MTKPNPTTALPTNQKQLDKLLSVARREGYEIGKKENFFPMHRLKSAKAYTLINALTDFLDDEYEPYKEDY